MISTAWVRFGAPAIFGAIVIAACATMGDPAKDSSAASAPSGAQKGAMSIETLSNRADLVSGGDVLVRVTLPEGSNAGQAMLSMNGGSAGALRKAPDGKGWLALVNGLKDGKNTLTLSSGGKSVKLDVTNHANGGPVFSGPQIQPWTCKDGAVDAQCNRPATISWSYMPTVIARAPAGAPAEGRAPASPFKPYDPASPPKDIAMTTTSEGQTLPYIVRTELFTQNRSGVSIAVLFDPKKTWDPLTPQEQWNKGVLVLQGAGCGTGYGEQPAGSPMNDRALKQGFAVVTVALLHNTINCNPVVQAEAAMMAKERLIESYGPIDIIFGMGGSGGAISQIMDQNAYPGLYDGLILNHLFADSDASRTAAYDCRLAYDAWAKPGALPWTEEQKAAVVGMISGCNASPTRFQIYNPAVGTNCEVADAVKFDPVKNPRGVRCTLQDYEVNQVGRRPDGAAYGRLDNTGVQYGLKALLAKTISPEQFVELNTSIGGHDINFNPLPKRTEADRAGLTRLYQTGLANTEGNLDETAIIETRLSVMDFHQPFHAVMVRARLERAQGNHDNYALWRTPAARESAMDASFDVMVQWLKAIKADTRDVPKSKKVVDNKPALARDRCIVEGADAPLTSCPRPPELARVLAGAPDTNDSGKCQLKSMRRSDYAGITFSDDQWKALQGIFPNGVCDYSKAMVDFGYAKPWLVYSGDGRASPLGPAPKSK